MNKEEIQKQAKKIMDSFANALEKVKIEESRVERKEDRRAEGEGFSGNPAFRKIMLENAPNVKDECIEAEKGGWLE